MKVFLSNPRTHYGPNLEVEVTVTAAILQKKRDWQAY